MMGREKELAKMKHKVIRLKSLVSELELAVIDEDDYKMANTLFWIIEEVKNEYNGMEVKE